MSFYEMTVPQYIRMLDNLSGWLDKAVAYAGKRGFDPAVFVQARLAPDQYPLVKQIQAACDSAKFAVARLTGKEPPRHPDTEQTLDELRARIRSCLEFLRTFTPDDFEGSESRAIALPFLEGKSVRAENYLVQLSLPNFYFHVSHAYAILRHNGVDLGKSDFIGPLTLIEP